jgi:hypothetical protein
MEYLQGIERPIISLLGRVAKTKPYLRLAPKKYKIKRG